MMKSPVLTLSTRPLASNIWQQCVCRRYLTQDSIASASRNAFPSAAIVNAHNASPKSTTDIRPSSKASDPYAAMKAIRLPHKIPAQLLIHVDPSALTKQELAERSHLYRWAMAGHVDAEHNPKHTSKQIKGVVVSAGKMDRTVKVRVPGQRYDKRVNKYVASYTNHLTHDPNNSLREGDVVILHRLHVSKTVKHIVASIEVPFGAPIEERASIPTPEQRLQSYKEKRIQRLDLRMLRVRAAAGSNLAQRELLNHKQHKHQQLTEATIKQAEAYVKNWMRRHNAFKAPRLRTLVVPRKTARERRAERVTQNDPAWANKQGAIALKEMAAANTREVAEKDDELLKKGLQTPGSS